MNRQNVKALLKSASEEMEIGEGVSFGEIEVILAGRNELRELNRIHLNHDYETDILTFDLSETGGPIDGQIFISPEVVNENSSRFATEFGEELLRVVIHGMLHLAGYHDSSKEEKAKMRRTENKYLKKIGQCRKK